MDFAANAIVWHKVVSASGGVDRSGASLRTARIWVRLLQWCRAPLCFLFPVFQKIVYPID